MADVRYVCESNGHKYAADDLPANGTGPLLCAVDRSPLLLVGGAAARTPPGTTTPRTEAPRRGESDGPTGGLRIAHTLRIAFDNTVVTVRRGEEVMLGRDPEYSPHAAFFGGYDNVSRQHAVLGLELDGRAWIRDCYATNLTKVNSEPVDVGKEQDLRHGDRVRLCANLAGTVELFREVSDVA